MSGKSYIPFKVCWRLRKDEDYKKINYEETDIIMVKQTYDTVL